jgi:hypothetical protein
MTAINTYYMILDADNLKHQAYRITLTIISNILVFILSGCITPFDLKYDDNEFLLVVDGNITQKNTKHKLFLRRSLSIGSPRFSPVNEAEITLFDQLGNSEKYIEEGNGEYYISGNKINRYPGNTYYIEILLKNNKIYRSTPQIMPEVMRPERLDFKLEIMEEIYSLNNTIEKYYLNLYVSTPIKKNNTSFYFTWKMDHVFSFAEVACPQPPNPEGPPPTPKICYAKRNYTGEDIRIFSSEDLYGNMLENFMVATLEVKPLEEFFEKHFYNVAQHSITKEAYLYWETVKNVSKSTGSIFDIPPGPVKGNIYNINDPDERVLGFFEVSSVDTIRTYTFGHDLKPLAIDDPCFLGPSSPACCNCLLIENSKVERPGYWGYIISEEL